LVTIIGEAFIRAKQSLTCLIDPNNTCVCCHYEPSQKRSFLNPYGGAAFNGIGIAQVRASRGISGFGLTVCSKLDARD
jgi:hypothetical protein